LVSFSVLFGVTLGGARGASGGTQG
jgi:hypothetical protein